MIKPPVLLVVFTFLSSACADVVEPAGEPTTGVEPFDEPASGSSGTDDSGEEAPDDCVGGCDDGLFCNGTETCVDGVCTPGEPPACADGVGCTADWCDEERDECVHTPDDAACGCGETCDPELGCGDYCSITTCQGHVYQCGNCIDDDGDCVPDDRDPDCWGFCDNNESGWHPEIPGDPESECHHMECFFDQDSGGGNDQCHWSHGCDPLTPSACTYDPDMNLPGTSLGCDELGTSQAPECVDLCSPLVPNGCDCFGCCEVTLGDQTVTVYLGTTDEDGHGTCNLDVAADPVMCNPCTQVPSCFNACDECELCFGQQELPPECGGEQKCDNEAQPCGLPGQAPCPDQFACVTGCCVPPIP